MNKHVQAYMIGLAVGAEIKEAMQPELFKLRRVAESDDQLLRGFLRLVASLTMYMAKSNIVTFRAALRLDVGNLVKQIVVAPLGKKRDMITSFYAGVEKASTFELHDCPEEQVQQ